jgi:argininosuccinate synthase
MGFGRQCRRFFLPTLAIAKLYLAGRLPEFFERFPGRQHLLEYCSSNGIPVTATKGKPWSMVCKIQHLR